MEKLKLINNFDVEININLLNISNKVIPVLGKGFALVTEEEYNYIANTSTIFQTGILSLDKNSESTNIEETNTVIYDDATIDKLLKKKNLTDALSEINEIIVLDKIKARAIETEKKQEIIDTIQKRIEAVS